MSQDGYLYVSSQSSGDLMLLHSISGAQAGRTDAMKARLRQTAELRVEPIYINYLWDVDVHGKRGQGKRGVKGRKYSNGGCAR